MGEKKENVSKKFSVIIPVNNMFKQIILCFNPLFKQINMEDQIIIADNASIDGLSDDFYPTMKHVSYFKSVEKIPDSILLNIAIREYAVNDHIMIIDPLSIIQNNFVSTFRTLSDGKTIILCRADRYNQKRSIIPDRRIPVIEASPEICDMYAMSFPRDQAFRIGLFNEYFTRDDSCSHGITLCDCLTIVENCNIIFTEEAKVIRQVGRERKNNEGSLCNVLRSKIIDGTYRYLDDNGRYRILKEGLLPKATIIIPSKQCEELIEETKEQIRDGDDLIIFNGGPSTIDKKVKESIKSAKNDCVILLNPQSIFCASNFIIDMKLCYNRDIIGILPSDEYETSHITSDQIPNIKDDLNMVFFKGLFSDDMLKVSPNSSTNRIIKKIATSSTERKELIRRIELAYEKDKKREKIKKVRPGIDKSSPGKKVAEKPVKGPKVAKERKKVHKTYPSKQISPFSSIWDMPKLTYNKNTKPRILLISDVKGWAWWYKSEQLKKHLGDEFEFDIVSVVDSRQRINTSAYSLCMTFGYSYVYVILDAPIHKRITGITAHRPSSLIRPRMQECAVTHANSILLLNELKRMHSIVYYVPNGVDEELFRVISPIPEDRKQIAVGHIGKICPQKGQKEYIEPAVKKANAKYINNYSSYLNKKPFDKMYELYQEMDVFIVSSIEDGTPNPALEAAACGRPIISNRIGNMPEFIKDGYNGFLVDRYVDAYVEKINYLANNRDKLIEMGNNARKTVEEGWTWKIQAENYRRMFREILYTKKIVEDLYNV